MTEFAYLFFVLLFGHALADYPLQGEFLAQAKNRNTEVGKVFWMHALPAHSIIHGGFVLLITSSLPLALAETIIHGVTDYLKCEGRISLHADQAIHVLCKVIWATAVVNLI